MHESHEKGIKDATFLKTYVQSVQHKEKFFPNYMLQKAAYQSVNLGAKRK